MTVASSVAPRPGDLTACIDCALVMIFADDMTVRGLTREEMEELRQDPEMVEAVLRLTTAIQHVNAVKN